MLEGKTENMVVWTKKRGSKARKREGRVLILENTARRHGRGGRSEVTEEGGGMGFIGNTARRQRRGG